MRTQSQRSRPGKRPLLALAALLSLSLALPILRADTADQVGSWGPWSGQATHGVWHAIQWRVSTPYVKPDAKGLRPVWVVFRNDSSRNVTFNAVVTGPGDQGARTHHYDIASGKIATDWYMCHVPNQATRFYCHLANVKFH